MKIILINSIKNLGKSGQLKTVKNGYARNYLFPKELAILATPENILKMKKQKIIYEKKKLFFISEAKRKIKEIKKLGTIIIFVKSNTQKKIFGSVNASQISKKITQLGIVVKKNEIKLNDGLLRYLGDHFVTYEPYKNININIKISILCKK
ncbi:50S ribosomal protein L9 [Buchnera aphidicola]|uniref:Large ribosomal subunit protein bL9 n=1 Tax=Buchnera aphidicola subsp. Tuberolachnus salignus TaxID=98804 RepID=A0A160SZF2_BUCTT|nr:50S ribosomal protein L9 [Buchnera aphidicola]CUR53346.1 50S ribosomal protein L9 [Buchnera aphidicola (Tuberolachnus salignus)]